MFRTMFGSDGPPWSGWPSPLFPFASRLTGVGQSTSAIFSLRLSPFVRFRLSGVNDPALPASALVGVGQRTISTRFEHPAPDFARRLAIDSGECGPFVPFDAVGVGHSLAIVDKLGRTTPERPASPPMQLPYSLAVGVGQHEDSISSVGSADIGRSYTCPLRIEPDFGKVTEDSIETPGNEGCDVLNERDSRS